MKSSFFQGHCPHEMIREYGSPLYLYNERVLREKCRDMKNLSAYPNFRVNYALKANTNLSLAKIIREEGLCVDVSSQGEAIAAIAAGYTPAEIMFIVNNVSSEELMFAVSHGFTVSVDSISQLKTYGEINPGGKITIRFNPGVGGGHHKKVVTGGEKTKFGISTDLIPEVKKTLTNYRLKLEGINHHIGSQNEYSFYLNCAKHLLEIAKQFEDLDFIDIGGGFGVPYKKDETADSGYVMPGESLTEMMHHFAKEYGKSIQFIIEPGRYVAAQCGRLLGTFHSVKRNGSTNYAGCDIGFSVFPRTTLYDAYHEIKVIPKNEQISPLTEVYTIVGNQCETGDYIAENRLLPVMRESDLLCIYDAGAYGYTMSSQYNLRLRPAEILICDDNTIKLIRKRDTYEDLLANMQLYHARA